MKRVMITGASGLLGVSLIRKMSAQELHLLYRNSAVACGSAQTYSVRLEHFSELDRVVDQVRPDVIIHTAGLTSVEKCQEYPLEAFCSNVLSARHVAQVSAKYGHKLVHISTDHFSKSMEAMSAEDSIEIPQNHYAKTKLEGEYEVGRYNPNALIVRTNFFGRGYNENRSFSDFIVDNLREEREVTLFRDIFYTPILMDDLIDCLERLIELDIKGVVNVVGDERLSKYDFGLKLARVFGLNQDLIRPGLFSVRDDLEPRPQDMSLSNRKLKNLIGDIDLSLESGLEKLKNLKGQHIVTLPNSVSFINYGKQSINEDDIYAVVKTLRSDYLTQGPAVEAFEQKVADFVGAKYAVAVCNLSCALHLACLAMGVGQGDSVVTSPLSFVASANCAVHVGANPAFADIDPETLNIDPEKVEEKCRKLGNVKAIIPVHFAGSPCDMESIKQVADKYGALVIEDAAHALGGAHFNGKMIGSCADSLISGFSFHPVKSMTTAEGGVLTTNDEKVYLQLLRLRSHGINKGNDEFKFSEEKKNPWYYEMQQLGLNYRISDIQCSLGISQLDRVEEFIRRRIQIAQKYDRAFKGLSNIKILQEKTRSISGNHLYVVSIHCESLGMERAEVFKRLHKEKIGVHVHYIPIPMQPFYREHFSIPEEDYLNALAYYRSALTLPLFPSMGDDQVNRVIEKVLELVS